VWKYKQQKFCTDSNPMSLMMEMELISETLEFINLLTRLSAQENFTEFCGRENFKIYIRGE
jgi:hypothetical protein